MLACLQPRVYLVARCARACARMQATSAQDTKLTLKTTPRTNKTENIQHRPDVKGLRLEHIWTPGAMIMNLFKHTEIVYFGAILDMKICIFKRKKIPLDTVLPFLDHIFCDLQRRSPGPLGMRRQEKSKNLTSSGDLRRNGLSPRPV